ncbi:MAG: phosphoglucosamine mutase [Myxococcales bacterium]|nr:MAG: phosphoglucosamine mutase [Myxococcales bacterium]
MRKLFGTDGIRGTANIPPMDAPTAYKVGAAVGSHFRAANRHPKIYIGRDTRLSGAMLEGALASGLCAVGAEAVSLGVVTTPGVAHLTRTTDADAGVMISASHNPFIDNGIKIFSHDGFKLPDDEEEKIEALIFKENPDDLNAQPHEIGSITFWNDAEELYIAALATSVGADVSLKGMKIVVDCANGAAYRIAPETLGRLGIDLKTVGVTPDGRNINKACGSLHPPLLQDEVRRHGADLGVAFDGDADRAIFVDAAGDVVDGDQIMAICARKLKQEGKLRRDTLVATVMSNIGLERAMNKLGVKVVKTAVGDRYVVEEMRAKGYNFGGEQSGHLIFLDHGTSGDGILTALQVMSIVSQTGRPLRELAGLMTVYPQVLKNLMVAYKRPLGELESVQRAIADAEARLGRDGRVLVRYSGTENKARVMVEGLDRDLINRCADEIITALDAELN